MPPPQRGAVADGDVRDLASVALGVEKLFDFSADGGGALIEDGVFGVMEEEAHHG